MRGTPSLRGSTDSPRRVGACSSVSRRCAESTFAPGVQFLDVACDSGPLAFRDLVRKRRQSAGPRRIRQRVGAATSAGTTRWEPLT